MRALTRPVRQAGYVCGKIPLIVFHDLEYDISILSMSSADQLLLYLNVFLHYPNTLGITCLRIILYTSMVGSFATNVQ